MVKVVWENPPPRTRVHSSWFDEYVEPLKQAPVDKQTGEPAWARVREYDKPTTAGSTTGALRKKFGEKGFEFASRTIDGKGYVYARFVPIGSVSVKAKSVKPTAKSTRSAKAKK